TVLLVPEKFEPPQGDDARVLVRLELAGGHASRGQLALANQARILLDALGFQEAVGYDHRGHTSFPHTRPVGTIPLGPVLPPKFKVEEAPPLVKDLRSQPSGWLGPVLIPDELPAPLRHGSPIRIIEVMPDKELPYLLPEPEAKELPG